MQFLDDVEDMAASVDDRLGLELVQCMVDECHHLGTK